MAHAKLMSCSPAKEDVGDHASRSSMLSICFMNKIVHEMFERGFEEQGSLKEFEEEMGG